MLELTFRTPVLGSTPLDPDIYSKFILGRNEDESNGLRNLECEQILATAEWLGLQGKTELSDQLRDELVKLQNASHGFFRKDGIPHLACWVIKGFLKEAAGYLRKDSKSHSANIYAYKKLINGTIQLPEQFIPMEFTGPTDWFERPLRGDTAQGERVALLRSERAPAGSRVLPFQLTVIGTSVPLKLLREWLDYGQLSGLGQYRNGAWGRFEYALTPVDFGGRQVGEMMFTRSLEEWANSDEERLPKPKRTYTRRKRVAKVDEEAKPRRKYTRRKKVIEVEVGEAQEEVEPEIKPAITKQQATKLTKSVMRRSARQAELVDLESEEPQEPKARRVKYPREV